MQYGVLVLGTIVSMAMAFAESAEAVLRRMDAAGPQLRGVTANLKRVAHTAVIDDDIEETGTFSLLKGKGGDLRVIIDVQKPDVRQVALNDRKAEIFNPKANVVQEFDLGKQKGLVDQFLLLGFGVTGKELSRNYSVKYQGDASVAGQKCSQLELTPKSAEVRQHFNRIELCVAAGGGYPVRQKLSEPSGNYTEITYSDIQLNPNVNPEQFVLRLPKGVKREYPQR